MTWKSFFIAALVVGATIGVFAYFDFLQPVEASLNVRVIPDGCKDPERSMAIEVKNDSRFRTIGATRIGVIVRQSGYSSELEHDNYYTDKILGPGQSYRWCESKPGETPLDQLVVAASGSESTYVRVAPKDLTYSAEILSATAD